MMALARRCRHAHPSGMQVLLALLALGLTPALTPLPVSGSAPVPGVTSVAGEPQPSPAAEKRAALDRLLSALKTAPTAEVAKPLEDQIRQLWLNAGSPAVTLLMSRGLRQLKADSAQEAIDDFSDALVLDPTLAEAYHQRAIARFTAGDLTGAVADIRATLQHEPRSFAAFETLSEISQARKDWKGAYEAWQKVLEIDPKTPGGEERLKDLRRRALGEEA